MIQNKNIILIGMCGVGKSTVGVLLAKALHRCFIDTDVTIQAAQQKGLQDMIDQLGLQKFRQIEEDHILSLKTANAVIATGGSVVYSQKAMNHLAENGIIIHLDLDLDSIAHRVTNLSTRGIVKEKTQTLESLYHQRRPLYEKYANLTVDCAGKTQDQITAEIVHRLENEYL